MTAVIEYDGMGTYFKKSAWGYADVSLDQNYEVFNALTGFRSDDPPLIPLRGIPDQCSAMAEELFQEYVIDEDEVCESAGEEYVLRSEAEKWIAEGKSRYVLDFRGEPSRHFVIRPGLQYATWMFLDEIQASLRNAGITMKQAGWLWDVTLKTMAAIEEAIGSHRVRLLFWLEF
jgi:hypothetical protein